MASHAQPGSYNSIVWPLRKVASKPSTRPVGLAGTSEHMDISQNGDITYCSCLTAVMFIEGWKMNYDHI